MNAPTIFYAILFICISNVIQAQDTLPNFTVRDLGKNKIQISWVNPYENCIQLAVQRSFDSTRFFRTIYSAQSPSLPQNGYVDTKFSQGVKVYYRMFYVLSEGNYFFTQAKTPHPDLPYAPNLAGPPAPANTLPPVVPPVTTPRQIITIYLRNTSTLLAQLDYYPDYTRFRDSIITKTKDSLQLISPTQVLLKPYIAKLVWKPSPFVFTNTHGLVTISLPAFKMHKYKLVVFEEDGTTILFEIKQVKESPLTLDKANFIHAGWFSFELYEDDKVKEKNKFYVGKEF